MKVTIKGIVSNDPKTAIQSIEAVTRSICQAQGKDPAEGVMMLLTAAAHIHSIYQKPGTDTLLSLAAALGHATVAADGFFRIRPVQGDQDHVRER